VARFGPKVGLTSTRVWDDYTLWQFSSEINCSPQRTCFHRVPGTASDMDVNVFNGDLAALRALFE
jgi:lysozyme